MNTMLGLIFRMYIIRPDTPHATGECVHTEFNESIKPYLPVYLTHLYIFPWTKKHLKGENISVFLFFLKHQSGIVVVKPRVMALN